MADNSTFAAAACWPNCMVTKVVDVATNQAITIQVYQYSAGTKSLTSGSQCTYVSIMRVE
jgi:hypothetical protein